MRYDLLAHPDTDHELMLAWDRSWANMLKVARFFRKTFPSIPLEVRPSED